MMTELTEELFPKTKSSSAADLASIAKMWPEWRIIKELGAGTYGRVYEAVRKGEVQSKAAIKIISLASEVTDTDVICRDENMVSLQTDADLKKLKDNVINEIRVLESFKGLQNIVNIEDYGVLHYEDKNRYDILIRMELLTPLSEFISQNNPGEKDIVRMGIDLCTALEECAKKGVIHKDIKPDNIFVNSFGYYKLGDFGIARNIEKMQDVSTRGTYSFMAPEMVTDMHFDERVDIYSLGIVLYRLLNNNRIPFIQSDMQDISSDELNEANIRRLRGDELPPPANASDGLKTVVAKACAFRPEERYSSAREMKKALQLLEHQDVNPPDNPEKPDLPVHFWLKLSLILMTVLLIGGSVILLTRSGKKSHPSATLSLATSTGELSFTEPKTDPRTEAKVEPQTKPQSEPQTEPQTVSTKTVAPTEETELETTGASQQAVPLESLRQSDLKTGMIVTYGRYEQDNNQSNGPEDVEWILYLKGQTNIYLISRFILDISCFSNTLKSGTFKESSLDQWLDSFHNHAFTSLQKDSLAWQDLDPPENDEYPQTEQEGRLYRKVAVFSLNELKDYLSPEYYQAQGTPYALAKGLQEENGFSPWWTRTMGKNGTLSCFVTSWGELDYYGLPMTDGTIGVRPVISFKYEKFR